jgi:hypothetical protein
VTEAAEQVCRSWGTATSTSTSGPTGGIAAEILVRCRADPALDAPLVRALMEATDPGTGRPLSDEAICAELGERPPRLCPGARWP